MKQLLLLGLVLYSTTLFGQYFQQRTDYTIQVTLDDVNNKLLGDLSLIYTNNSPNVLNQIHFHLWPNGYKSDKTPMSMQDGGYGTELLKKTENRGYMDSLHFQVNQKDVKVTYVDPFQEMVIIHLNQPLNPGESINITTPFRVKIPHNAISRLGHYDNSYQITQWYPKPAVYDKNGWHHMPYLTQGEFYSEFGSFDVSITLPSNYVLGASGNLQTESEKQFLSSKIQQAPIIIDSLSKLKRSTIAKENELWNPVITSSKDLKTVRYTLDNVHDFAFFAEKGYIVQSGSVILPHSGREIKLYTMYYPSNFKIWNNSIDYLRDAVYNYSLWNGDYPYDICTAVDGAIAAGGGMEYPTITVIGNCSDTVELDLVIAHEVGHNWFYGILGTNERATGWMDEGVNSFNEMRYMQLKYGNLNMAEQLLPNLLAAKFPLTHKEMYRVVAQLTQQLGVQQALNTHSEDFHSMNYGTDMYQRTAISLLYLQTYLGEQLFDKCMQVYFEKWKFQHPYPEDMQAVFEEVSGKKLDWFFKDIITTRKIIDYRIKKVKKTDQGLIVELANPGQIDGPILVQLIKNKKIVAQQIAEPNQKEVVFDASIPYDFVALDYERKTGDIYLNNNQTAFQTSAVKPKKVGFISGIDLNQTKEIYFLPSIGVNQIDGFQLGAIMHNYGIPLRRFQYIVMPMYGFKSKTLTALADFNWRLNHVKFTSASTLGFTLKGYQNFMSFLPYWRINLNNPKKSTNIDQDLVLQGIIDYIHKGVKTVSAGAYLQYEVGRQMNGHHLSGKFRASYLRELNHTTEMARITAEARYSLTLPNYNNFLDLRLFVGANNLMNNSNTDRYYMNLSGNTGYTDVFRENTYHSRTGSSSSQRDNNLGAMGINLNDQAKKLLIATRISIGIPKVSFIRPYYDFAVGDFFYTTQHVAGMSLQWKQWVGIYFPLYSSNYDLYTKDYTNYMSFFLRWNIVEHPIRLKSFLR